MEGQYDVEVKVISQKGTCVAEHKVGDSWIVGHDTAEGICVSAFGSIIPSYRVLRFGGEYPWMEDKDRAIVACPDPKNPVVFELRRIR